MLITQTNVSKKYRKTFSGPKTLMTAFNEDFRKLRNKSKQMHLLFVSPVDHFEKGII